MSVLGKMSAHLVFLSFVPDYPWGLGLAAEGSYLDVVHEPPSNGGEFTEVRVSTLIGTLSMVSSIHYLLWSTYKPLIFYGQY